MDYIEIDAATNKDPPRDATFAGYVSSHPDVKLVVTDTAVSPPRQRPT